jgi:predicted transglutaminase-like cysteine proteinase
LITVVRKPNGEGHAVLTVRTDRGDFVLDNLNDSVKLWNATNYRYLKRQASNHTGRWVSLREGNNPVVGAVSE